MGPGKLFAGAMLIVIVYLFGVLSHYYRLWPVEQMAQIKARWAGDDGRNHSYGNIDRFERSRPRADQHPINCPRHQERMAVILVLGQSNAGNHGGMKYRSRYPDRAVSFFDGRCYSAESPLPGASGSGGEFLTLLADDLISRGTYDVVVIVSTAIGASPISRWETGGDLFEMSMRAVRELPQGLAVTHVIWHHGETDVTNSTSRIVYRRSFRSLLDGLIANDIRAPVFAAVSTKCGPATNWSEGNPVASALRELVEDRLVALAFDADRHLTTDDRLEDQCHMNEAGLRKAASAYSTAISARRAN